MPLTDKEVADLKRLIKQEVLDSYPDLATLLAADRIALKAGWYRANDKEAFDMIARWASSFRMGKDGKAEVKVARPPSKRLKALAEKL